MRSSRRLGGLVAASIVALTGACSADPGTSVESAPVTTSTSTIAGAAPTSTTVPAPATTSVPSDTSAVAPRPDWLGTRVLPVGPNGFGEIQPTPAELVDRRFATIDLLPPPTSQAFAAEIHPVPDDVAARSTWTDACPVGLDDLRYVTLSFWGFDERAHTGELLVHADAVNAVVLGFRQLFDRRFPIEEMRVVHPDELDAPPTGDGNNTTAFVCRPTRGSGKWSEHAYGRAVDINPFHNPYVKGDIVLPELASAYVDRTTLRPGMLSADDVAGFGAAGWGWGGQWRSLRDHMHVSANGR